MFDYVFPVCAEGFVIRKDGEDWLYVEAPGFDNNDDDFEMRVSQIVETLNIWQSLMASAKREDT